MKQTIFSGACGLAAVLALTGLVLADQPPPATSAPTTLTPGTTDGPRIKFDQETFDAGKVPPGQALNHTFIFTNVGNQTLEVTKVTPGCGCTVPGTWTKTVEPGKTGTIPIQVNVNAAWNGMMTKNISVESNDKSHPGPTTIFMQFTVWKPFDINKQYVYMNVPAEATNDVMESVRVHNNTTEPLAIFEGKSTSPAIGVELKTNEIGKDYEVVVNAKAPFKQGSNPSGQITFKTSATNMATVNIGVTANIMPVIRVIPPSIVLDAGPLTNVVQKPVTIEYLGANPIQVSNAVFTAKGVDVQLTGQNPGTKFAVTLSFPPGFDANGRTMELTLNTSSTQMPVVRVGVTQMPHPPIRAIAPGKSAASPSQAGLQIR
jgi:hypothetical protein